jgi:hypothetical protein
MMHANTAAVTPTITVYHLPTTSQANGAAVIVCPGGAYSYIADEDRGSIMHIFAGDRGQRCSRLPIR